MKMHNKTNTTSGLVVYVVTGTFITLTFIFGLVLSSSFASADDVVDQINITVPVSCTISGTGMNTHNAEIQNGTYQANIGTTTLHAFCNDNNGFAIYAAGYTGNEIGATNSNKLVGTTASGNATIDTGTATSAGNPDVSNWAMKLGTVSSPTPTYPITITTGYDTYHAVPNEYTKVAYRNSSTDIGQAAEGSKLTTTYGAYISKTQPADTYFGKVIYTLVHPSDAAAPTPSVDTPAGYISYNPNATGVVDTMGDQSINTTDTSATLWASNFKRSGYGFAGWNDKSDYTGNNYGPNETISFTAGQYTGDNKGLSLYATWVKSAGNLQGWSGCSSLASGAVTALTDTRDNNTYAVAKLADGNCWMIENLRLANQTLSGTPIILNSTNTNNPAAAFTQLSVSTDPSSRTRCNPGEASCVDQSTLFSGNTTNPVANMTASNEETAVYSYGNYYNWYSATAGNGTYSKSSGNTTGDICPTGWHLPTGGASGEYYVLASALGSTSGGSTSIRSYPNNYVYSGVNDGVQLALRGRSLYGIYWSSTGRGNNLEAYTLYFDKQGFVAGTNEWIKTYDSVVRCMIAGS